MTTKQNDQSVQSEDPTLMLEELDSRVRNYQESVDQRMRDLELDVASRRNYEKVAILLGYGAVALIALLGFVGFANVSDIDEKVRERIDFNISKTDSEKKATFDEFEIYNNQFKDLLSKLEDAEETWRVRIKPALDDLIAYEQKDEHVDLQGRLNEIMHGEIDANDPAWRLQATALVSRAIEHIANLENDPNAISQFSPDDLFNLAQISRNLGRYDLENNLTSAAFKARKSSASAEALFLQSEARKADSEKENNPSFEKLLDLVSHVTIDSPHIVIAEAWNTAESLRQYSKLISAIDKLVARHGNDASVFLPSYAYVVKGQAHLRRGIPGDLDASLDAFLNGVRRLREEGVHSQWADATMRDILENVEFLFLSGMDTTALDEAIRASGIVPISQRYFFKKNELGIMESLFEQLGSEELKEITQ